MGIFYDFLIYVTQRRAPVKYFKAIAVLVLLLLTVMGCAKKESLPYLDTALSTEERVKDLVGRMTLDEKLSLFAGKDFWHTQEIERLGVPSIRMTDCAHGVTVSGDMTGPATCFPTSIGRRSSCFMSRSLAISRSPRSWIALWAR